MQNKILKAQFNEMCLGGLILDMNSVAMFSGDSGLTALEVTSEGIHLQPGVGNPIVMSTFDIKGPLYKSTMPPADYLPGITNPTPRKTFDLPILKQFAGISVATIAYTGLAGGSAWLKTTTEICILLKMETSF